MMKKRFLIILAAVIFCAAMLCACSLFCEHEFGEWETVTPATETGNGTQERVCLACGEKEKGVLYATGSKGLYFVLDETNNTAKVKSYVSNGAEEVYIPEYYSGHKVVGIESLSFKQLTKTKKIHIPSTVTDIAYRGFYWCEALESITIPASVTTIGKSAFVGCTSLESFEVEKGNKVYHSAGNCIIETESKTLIAGCKTSVIPADGSVTSIYSAFAGCTTLESITIPESVTKIGQDAFSGCTGLTDIKLPSGVTVIEQRAFGGTGIIELKIPESITAIEAQAFSQCPNLKSVIVPESVKRIDGLAFSGCEALTTVNISNGITVMSLNLFMQCKNLVSITIPSSVTEIADNVFYLCEGLTTINFTGTKSQWNSISKGKEWNFMTGDYTVHCTDGTIEKK